MLFSFEIPLVVHEPGGGRPEAFVDSVERVAETLSDLEESTPGLLDTTLSADRSDTSVLIELTIEAADIEAGSELALSCVRSAIHAAGDHTPSWDSQPARFEIAAGHTGRQVQQA